jgi:hypothetical protein
MWCAGAYGCHAPAGRVVSRQVWIDYQGQQFAVRCLGVRLSEEQRAAAQRRKKRSAQKKQHQLQPDTLYLAGWVLLITTLPREQWSAQQVLRLYQARWHIELVFKRIKQLLKHQHLRCQTAATALPTITALLLGWALQEEESTAIRLAMRDAMQCTQQVDGQDPPAAQSLPSCWWQEGRCGPLSEWMVAEVSLDLLRQQIRGHYTAAQYRACLPRLQRFLCLGQRKRPHPL